MHVITTASIKGGSGKTTLTQVIASGALALGKRVHMIDGDADQQLLDWETKAGNADYGDLPRLPWPEGLTVSRPPSSVEALYAEIRDWEAACIDYLLIDTRPGENRATEDLILAADIVLVPVRPVQSDFLTAGKTVAWLARIIESLHEDEPAPLMAAALIDADKKALDYLSAETKEARDRAGAKVHAQDREVYEAVKVLKPLPTPIPTSTMMQRMPISGPLTYTRDMYAQDPTRLLQANHVKHALEICISFLTDLNSERERRFG